MGTKPPFLFIVLLSSFPLLFQPQEWWERCRTSYLLQDTKTSPVVQDVGDKGCPRIVTGAVLGSRCLEESGNTQVHAQGDGFLKSGENTHSSPSVRASGAAVLCPGICFGLGEHPHPLLLMASTRPPRRSIDFSFLGEKARVKLLITSITSFPVSLYLYQRASVGLCRKFSPF